MLSSHALQLFCRLCLISASYCILVRVPLFSHSRKANALLSPSGRCSHRSNWLLDSYNRLVVSGVKLGCDTFGGKQTLDKGIVGTLILSHSMRTSVGSSKQAENVRAGLVGVSFDKALGRIGDWTRVVMHRERSRSRPFGDAERSVPSVSLGHSLEHAALRLLLSRLVVHNVNKPSSTFRK